MSKVRIIVYTVLGLVCLAVGRYTAPKQTVTQVKEVVTHQVIVKTVKPDGTVITSVTTDKDNRVKAVVSTPTSKINISALAGVDTAARFKPVYGLSFNKEFIGPTTLGAYGLTNGTIGVSIGLDF